MPVFLYTSSNFFLCVVANQSRLELKVDAKARRANCKWLWTQTSKTEGTEVLTDELGILDIIIQKP